MATSDWKAPFLQLRDNIRPIYDAGVTLYHGILMAPFHKRSELKDIVQSLECCISGKTKVAVIETPTDGCEVHHHYFFGDSGGGSILGHSLEGIDDWIRAVPKDLIPRFNVPCTSLSKHHHNLATWASLVYYLAWEIDAPYLQATVEYQAQIDEVGFHPWTAWPQPEGCDPRPILIHQGDDPGLFEKMLQRFSVNEESQWCPDVIDAYLCDDIMCSEFIAASLATIDVLVFMLEQIRGHQTAKQNELSRPVKRKSNKPRRVSSDVMLLRAFLRHHHDPRENGEKALIPLTAKEIAAYMQWINDDGEPVQSRASRRMADIFGCPNGMDKYQSMFKGNIKKGFKTFFGDGSRDLEAIDDNDEDNESSENDLD